MFLGFSAGLPLALSGSTLLVWMREAGVDLGTIGLFALVGTPYTLKFLWAPVVDALDVPVLSRLLGRRRGWLVFSQLLLMAAIVFLAFCNPAISPWHVAFGALLVATASATQDIVIDAFRVESLDKSEQAAGMASYVAAYRIGMLVSTAGVLFLVAASKLFGFGQHAAWTLGYLAMAALVLIGIVTTLVATEPEQSASRRGAPHAGEKNSVKRVAQAAYRRVRRVPHPRRGDRRAAVRRALQILRRLRRRHDGAVRHQARLLDRIDYANIVKGVGLAATLIGGFAGGALARATAGDLPVDRRDPADGVEPGVHLAGAGRHQPLGADGRDHRREFHRRDRHGDLRRLSLGAVPEPAAHRDAVRAADRAGGGRPHLSVGRRRLSSPRRPAGRCSS